MAVMVDMGVHRALAQLLETFRNKLADARGHSFHFEQAPFRSMWTLLRYRGDGRTDRQTDGFSALYNRLANVPALSCRCS